MTGPPPAGIALSPCTADDVSEIVALYSAGSGRDIDGARIARNTSLYPAFVARETDGRMVGFVFSVDFAPDILELANIYVVPDRRSAGIGGLLMALVEKAAIDAGFNWIMLVNSMLYTATDTKRPATAFYSRHDYEIILDTGPSKVFAKRL